MPEEIVIDTIYVNNQIDRLKNELNIIYTLEEHLNKLKYMFNIDGSYLEDMTLYLKVVNDIEKLKNSIKKEIDVLEKLLEYLDSNSNQLDENLELIII